MYFCLQSSTFSLQFILFLRICVCGSSLDPDPQHWLKGFYYSGCDGDDGKDIPQQDYPRTGQGKSLLYTQKYFSLWLKSSLFNSHVLVFTARLFETGERKSWRQKYFSYGWKVVFFNSHVLVFHSSKFSSQ